MDSSPTHSLIPGKLVGIAQMSAELLSLLKYELGKGNILIILNGRHVKTCHHFQSKQINLYKVLKVMDRCFQLPSLNE